jgi:hypothetical protein
VNERELPVSDATDRVRHTIEAEVDSVRQDRRQQRRLVVGSSAIPLMREAVGEALLIISAIGLGSRRNWRCAY